MGGPSDGLCGVDPVPHTSVGRCLVDSDGTTHWIAEVALYADSGLKDADGMRVMTYSGSRTRVSKQPKGLSRQPWKYV